MARKNTFPLFDDQLEMLELLTDPGGGPGSAGRHALYAQRHEGSDLTGGAGVVLSGAAGPVHPEPERRRRREKGRASRKSRRNPVSEARKPLNGTKRNRTEPDRTEQNRTRRSGPDGRWRTAAPGALSHPPWMKCGLMFFAETLAGGPRPSSGLLPGPGWMVGKAPMRD